MQTGLEGLSLVHRTTAVHLTLFGDSRSKDIAAHLRSVGYGITLSPFPSATTTPINLVEQCDVALLDISTIPQSVLATLERVNAAIGIGNVRPRVLCYSTVHRNPSLVLNLQKCGARYARVSGPETLIEAIELLLCEMNEIEYHRPSFRIVHRYSRGTCRPGEEVTAVMWSNGGDFLHVPLGLAERLVFDLLARHRRIPLDSLQIVSTFRGDPFFQEHALNSGQRQVGRVRRPTVKVHVQRIRSAMASAFTSAHLLFNPKDVVRSGLAEGTNKVLYKLHADVRWQHLGE